jgi:ParB/RepB/Spo0J family partition protein
VRRRDNDFPWLKKTPEELALLKAEHKRQESSRKCQSWEAQRPFPKEMTNEGKASRYELIDIPIGEIYSDPDFNMRGAFTVQSILTLAETIKSAGLLSPISVQPYKKVPGKKYRIVMGHRRHAACNHLKWDTIPAFVVTDLSEYDAKLLNFMENVERKDCSILEEALVIDQMFGPDVATKEISLILNREERWVLRRRRLMRAPQEVKDAAQAGRIGEGRLDELLRLADEQEQLKTLEMFLAQTEGFVMGTAGPLERVNGGRRVLKNGKGQYNRPTMQELLEVLTVVLSAEVIGLSAKCIAYCAGWLPKEELLKCIAELQETGQLRNHGESPTKSDTYSFVAAAQQRDPD